MDFFGYSLAVWAGLVLAGVVVCSTAVAVYRVFFHPLARYPGPLLAKLTDGYMLYYAWKGERHLEFWRLHERYGPVVRFGPGGVSFNSATALKAIYGFQANVAKSQFYDAFVHPAPNTHNARDRALHARKRRVLSQAFSDGAMRSMERFVLGNVRTFCDVLGRGGDVSSAPDMAVSSSSDKGWSPPLNMARWCNYLAMDILGDLCFGKAFHMLERPDNRYAIDLVAVASQRHLLCGTMPVINSLSLDRVLFRRIAAGRARYMAYSRAQLAARTRQGEADLDRRDFFWHLLRARDPETGRGFGTPELWGESNLLIIAGADTTSTALAAALFYLVRHRGALDRLTAEVRGAFASIEDIHGPAASSRTPYLRACLDEAMRLAPSVPGMAPREVLAGGLVVDGHALPAGTVVGVPHYALHHHPLYFPEPFSFRPERWLPAEAPGGADAVARAHAAFCAFSIGPRGCIGKGLAYLELTTALARLVYRFDMRAAAAPEADAHRGEGRVGGVYGRHRAEEYQLRDTFTSVKDGPMVEFREREVVV